MAKSMVCCSCWPPGGRQSERYEMAGLEVRPIGSATFDGIDTERFLERVGLEAWPDRDLAWDQNGEEHAADTIAWGLMDRDIHMLRIGQPTAEEVTRGLFPETSESQVFRRGREGAAPTWPRPGPYGTMRS